LSAHARKPSAYARKRTGRKHYLFYTRAFACVSNDPSVRACGESFETASQNNLYLWMTDKAVRSFHARSLGLHGFKVEEYGAAREFLDACVPGDTGVFCSIVMPEKDARTC
jgi:hypothetical protein